MKIIPLVVGSLGAIPKQFGNRLKQIGIIEATAQVQKTALLGTARILRGRLLKSNATGCGSILTIFSSILLLSVSSIMVKFLEILSRCPFCFSHVLWTGEVLFSLP